MDIAVTREIKPREGRVAFLPAKVETLVAAGHRVFVETAAGALSGAVETCRPTTWDEPVYTEEGIRHYCVDNIPGAVPATASAGYGRDILPFVRLIAEVGAVETCRRQPGLARGLSFFDGTLTHAETGHYQDRPFTPIVEFLEKAG